MYNIITNLLLTLTLTFITKVFILFITPKAGNNKVIVLSGITLIANVLAP